jgi:DNA repair protein RecO (recombination protein O)
MFSDGVLCKDCERTVKDGISLNPSTLYALQYVVYADFKDLYTFTVTEEVLAELKMVMARCIHNYIDRRMNSLDILDVLEQNI